MTHFPYTHGDSLELAREKGRQEMADDLKNKQIEIEVKERERMGDEKYDSVKDRIETKDREAVSYP